MKIKGAIFDMDGTLLDSMQFWEYLWQNIGEKYLADASFKPCDEINNRLRTMIFHDAMVYFRSYYKLTADTDEFIEFASTGITRFYRDIVKPKPGAKALLEYLKGRKIKLCLASAATMDIVRYALESHDMLSYFDVVLSCADIGVGKEKPDIYRMAARLFNLSCNEVFVLEDSYVALETARNAGFQTVGVFDKYSSGQERLQKAADIYLDEQKTLEHLISVLDA